MMLGLIRTDAMDVYAEDLNTVDICTEADLDTYFDSISWKKVYEYGTVSDEFLARNYARMPWRLVLINQIVRMDLIDRLAEEFGNDVRRWDAMIDNAEQWDATNDDVYNLTDDDLLGFWELLGKYQPLSEDFMHRHFNSLPMDSICRARTLSESFIHENIERFWGTTLGQYQRLSVAFIDEHMDYLYMCDVCKYQALTEEFMESTYALPWKKISKHQKFSFEFMHRHKADLWEYRCVNTQLIGLRRARVNQLMPLLDESVRSLVESYLPISQSADEVKILTTLNAASE